MRVTESLKRAAGFTAMAMILLTSAPAMAEGKKTCFTLMASILRAPKKPVDHTGLSSLQKKLVESILNFAKEKEVEESVITELGKSLESMKRLPSREKLESFVIFLNTVHDSKQIEAAHSIVQFFDEAPESAFMKKYKKIQISVDRTEASELKRVQKRLAKEKPDAATDEIERLALREMREFRGKYEKLAYGCRSRKWTPERKAAAGNFKKFTIGIGLTSGTIAYSYANWDKEKDGVWFGRLGYEMTWGILSGFLHSKIISNPANGPLVMGLKGYMLSRTNGLIDMTLYGALFSASDDEAKERLEKILGGDEKKIEQAIALKKSLEERGFFPKFKENLLNHLRAFGGKIGLGDGKPAFELDGVDWDNITEQDLEREDVQAVLLAAAAAELYEENKGKLINTGDVGSDRYAFHAMYGFLMLPKDIMMNLFIFNTLCMGQLNPQRALFKAIGAYTANRLIGDQLYYWARRQSINQ